MSDLLRIITNSGFAIAISACLLIRIGNQISDLGRAIYELREAIKTMIDIRC